MTLSCLTPPTLESLAAQFDGMDAIERCDYLMAAADGAARFAPKAGQAYAIEIIRQDPGCIDRIGVHLSARDGRLYPAISLGPNVQTLTRALAALICEGLQGARPDEVTQLDPSIVRRIVGEDLVRQRSRTAYVILNRLKEAAEAGRAQQLW